MLKKKRYIVPFNDYKRRKTELPCSEKTIALLRVIWSKHCDEFYYLNCLHSFRTKKKLESHKRVCENKDLCNIIMPSEETKNLEIKQYQKFIIYADLECLIEKIDGCKNNPENSYSTKVNIFNQVFQCLQCHHLKA